MLAMEGRQMRLFHRKSMWQKAIEPITDHLNLDAKSLAKSGLTAAVSVISLTAASAAVSSLRRRDKR